LIFVLKGVLPKIKRWARKKGVKQPNNLQDRQSQAHAVNDKNPANGVFAGAGKAGVAPLT
jgi:hypothetical protein